MSNQFSRDDLAVVVLECVASSPSPDLRFNDQEYYSARFKDYKGYTISKAFLKPVSLGYHKFGLTSFKGKLNLTYISPI